MIDHHDPDTGECIHIWRTFTHEDRCVLCGADRAHELRGPYFHSDSTDEWGGSAA